MPFENLYKKSISPLSPIKGGIHNPPTYETVYITPDKNKEFQIAIAYFIQI